jgi:hypothetical protein
MAKSLPKLNTLGDWFVKKGHNIESKGLHKS